MIKDLFLGTICESYIFKVINKNFYLNPQNCLNKVLK